MVQQLEPWKCDGHTSSFHHCQSQRQMLPQVEVSPKITAITVHPEAKTTLLTKSRSNSSEQQFASAANSLLFINQLLLKMSYTQKAGGGAALYRKEVIRYFRLHLEMCSRIGAISFCWDKKRNEFGVLSDKKRYQFNFQMAIHIIHNIFLLWSMTSRDIGRFGVSYKMLCIYFNTGYVLCNGLRFFAWMREKEIVKLINANFRFQEQIRAVKREEDRDGTLANLLKKTAKSQKALVILGLVTGISVPTLVFCILLANPCVPPFIGSYVFEYTEDHHCRVTSWTLHLIISLINAWMHLDMVLPMTFAMFGLFFLSVSCLHDYIDVLKWKLKSAKSNDNYAEILRMYRRVQIMAIQLNACFRQHFFPLVLSGMTALLIFCLYSCIRLHDQIPMPGFSYFPLVALDGLVSILVMNTKAANVLEHSTNLITELRHDTTFKARHWIKKEARSLTPLKINFMMNYVDKTTPLIFINFALNQVVSLLLVGSERNRDVQIEDVLAN